MEDLDVYINNQKKAGNIKSFFIGPRIIFVVLGIILLLEIIYAVRTLTFSTPPSLSVQKRVIQREVGRISLIVAKTDVNVGEVVPVSVMVNSGTSRIDGVDVIIHFDPKFLEATSGTITKGIIFDEYPLTSVDTKNGLISISGLDNPKNSFKGSGKFAAINLKAKVRGKTSLNIDFKGKGETVDSNLLVEGTSKDILEQTDNLELNIK